jgi:enoyl-CoA hydratase
MNELPEPTFSDLRVSTPKPAVRLIEIHRPEARNALRNALFEELTGALREAANDKAIRAVVLTGGTKVFAAGADLKEMAAMSPAEVLTDRRAGYWASIRRFEKPLIAAVNGYALGGGCELAMHADIIVAGETAKFGQPELNIGILPGAGGTQRLPRTVGKSLAMKMALACEFIDAREALRSGLVAEVVPAERTIERAIELAEAIALKPPHAVRLAKEAVLKSFETPLEEGLAFERKALSLLFFSADHKEGVAAFLEKRKPNFKGE